MSEALEISSPELVKLGPKRANLLRHWLVFGRRLLVVALVLILSAPRLLGPMDVRWDAGVYYILGTSLAEGHGYRILSEPGVAGAIVVPLKPVRLAAICDFVK